MKRVKKLIMGIISATTLFSTSCGGDKAPKLGVDKLDDVVAAMTEDEKIMLLLGCGMKNIEEPVGVVGANDDIIPGAAGTTHGIPRLGIPSIVLADGPAGLRISPKRNDSTETYYCTAFPVATMLASTWNQDLVEEVGKAMGQEVKEYGVDVILGPGVNIHRNPLCGRNYEYYSEDPLLAGKIAASIIKGIQSNGVGTSIKHFACNNQETFRNSTDSRVSTRAQREIYFRQFDIAINDANPWTVMTSYNYLNGTYTSESKELNDSVLRKDMAFKGLVMTDWFAGLDATAQVNSGNDLLMPGTDNQYNQIKEGLKNGKIDKQAMDQNIKRILELILKTPRFQGYKFSNKPDMPAHAKITRQSAAEGIILLTNKNNALPLKNVKDVAVFGTISYEFVSGGTGSGDVNEEHTVSLTEGLRNAGLNIDENLENRYTQEIEKQRKIHDADTTINNAFVYKFMPENFEISDQDLTEFAKKNDAAVITIGRCSGEFRDRRIADFYLQDNEKKLLNSVQKAFSKLGKKVIVILNTGGVIETKSWVDTPDAVILSWMGGQEGGNAVADILLGKDNPSGKLPVSFAEDYFDYPSAKNFPYDYEANNKSMFGRGTERHNDENLDFTNYYEDIFVGYRYFSSFGKKTKFPFGYGLSYTTFEFSDLEVADQNDKITVKIKVKNTGKTAGKEVAEIYVTAPKSELYKPEIELKAFKKTKLLNPGEEQTLEMEISYKEMASFDSETSSWKMEKGEYQFKAGNSSENFAQVKTVAINNTFTEKCSDVLRPKQNFEVIKK